MSEQPVQVVLSGPPSKLRTTVDVANPSASRLSVREVVLRREGVADLGLPVSIIVAPGGRARVPLLVNLPAETRPGDYPAQLDVAGSSRPALLRVETTLDMTLRPSTVLVTAGSTAVSLTVTSRANVDVPLATVTAGRLCDGDGTIGPDATMTLSSSGVLHPGESHTLTATLDVPAELDPRRRWVALVPIGLADLHVIVLSHDNPNESAP
jgi:hypothetical protein